ncbi:fumarylacetoacetate hydrolase family protein [Geminicoccus harenae]|uniref:fumarylacetoacetate hydrolase family protein n=1 Tax=Geminicoccus harenae TaxID=2498453 RepID=UPI00168A7B82|nr:fumarylacetoacetate hydrolase family protein [Geminicoccus harenae]
MHASLTIDQTLPEDGTAGTLVGRVQTGAGPCVVAIREEGVFDLTPIVPTLSELTNAANPVALARSAGAERIGDLAPILANSAHDRRDPGTPYFLAPVDLHAIKACGVTFVRSMLERVIEEQARGDAAKSEAIRQKITAIVGDDLRAIVPGSDKAMELKEHLIRQGAWSQYLEVGIGKDAEVFTKSQPMSAVGTGALIGIHPVSTWNNPEPEIVLAVSNQGKIVGATLGNDVNLRDVEGRSALLLGKAKDNNGSAAIGPFIRLFDETFDLDTVRAADLAMLVEGTDGFRMEGHSSMSAISRDPADLVAQTIGAHHQYPDGFVLYLGTMFAPIQDRHGPGQGFTHAIGDAVSIWTPKLGKLVNVVQHADKVPAWEFGTGALMRNLAGRGLLRG